MEDLQRGFIKSGNMIHLSSNMKFCFQIIYMLFIGLFKKMIQQIELDFKNKLIKIIKLSIYITKT